MQRGATGTWQTIGASGETVRAFVPAPLPPTPPLDLSAARQQKLEQALLALGRLDAIAALLPEPDIFLNGYLRRGAVLSSQIEGTQSSLSDLHLFELDGAPGASFDDVVEVSNYVAALDHGMARLDFFLEGVAATAQDAVDTAHRLLALFAADRERLLGLGRAAPNALRVFDVLRHRPVVNIKLVAGRAGVSFATAVRMVEALEKLGIVREVTGRARAGVRLWRVSRSLGAGGGGRMKKSARTGWHVVIPSDAGPPPRRKC